MMTVDRLMAKWPSVPEFARDVGIKASHAHVMKVRQSIAPRHWPAIVNAAKKRNLNISLEMLASMAARRDAVTHLFTRRSHGMGAA